MRRQAVEKYKLAHAHGLVFLSSLLHDHANVDMVLLLAKMRIWRQFPNRLYRIFLGTNIKSLYESAYVILPLAEI